MEDLPLLADYLLQQVGSDLKTPGRRLHADALAELLSYSFPGNIRELRNLLERACILTSGVEITSFDLLHIAKLSTSPVFPEEFNLRMLRPIGSETPSFERSAEQKAAKRRPLEDSGLSKSDITYKLAKYGLTSASNDEEQS